MALHKFSHSISPHVIERTARGALKGEIVVRDRQVEIAKQRVMAQIDTRPASLQAAFERATQQLRKAS